MAVVTPDDAHEVWKALEKAGSTPTVRAVTDQLNASGRPVTRSVVGRWKKAGWCERQKRAPAPATVERECNAAAAALTGDPKATFATLREALLDIAGKDALTDLITKPAHELLTAVERESLLTAALAEILVRRSLLIGEYQAHSLVKKATADLLVSTVAAAKARALLPAPPSIPGDNAKVIEHDPLDPAWAAMRKAQAAA